MAQLSHWPGQGQRMHWTCRQAWPAGHCEFWWQPGAHSPWGPQRSQTCPPGQSESALQLAWVAGEGGDVGAGAPGGGVSTGGGGGAGVAQWRHRRAEKAISGRTMRAAFPVARGIASAHRAC